MLARLAVMMAMAISEVGISLVQPAFFANDAPLVVSVPWDAVHDVTIRPTEPSFIEERFRSGTRNVVVYGSKLGPGLSIFAFEDGGAAAQHVMAAWHAGWERVHLKLPIAVRVDLGVVPRPRSARPVGGRRRKLAPRRAPTGAATWDSDFSSRFQRADTPAARLASVESQGGGSGSWEGGLGVVVRPGSDGGSDDDDVPRHPSEASNAVNAHAADVAAAEIILDRFQAQTDAAASDSLLRSSLLAELTSALRFDRGMKHVVIARGMLPRLLDGVRRDIAQVRRHIPPPLPVGADARAAAVRTHEARRLRNYERARSVTAGLRAVSAALFACEALPADVRAGSLSAAPEGLSLVGAVFGLLEDPTPLYWVPGVVEAYHLALQEATERAERTGAGQGGVAPVVPGDPRYRHGRHRGALPSFRDRIEAESGAGETTEEAEELAALAAVFRVSLGAAREARDAALHAARRDARDAAPGARGAGPQRWDPAGRGGSAGFGSGPGRGGSPEEDDEDDDGMVGARTVVSTPFGTYTVGASRRDAAVRFDAQRREHVRDAAFAPFRLGYPAPAASGSNPGRLGPAPAGGAAPSPPDAARLMDLQSLLERTVPSNAELTAMGRSASASAGLSARAGMRSPRAAARTADTPYQLTCAREARLRGVRASRFGLVREPERYTRDVMAADRELRRRAARAMTAEAAEAAEHRTGFAPDGRAAGSDGGSGRSDDDDDDDDDDGDDDRDQPLTALERFRESLATGSTPYPQDPSRFYGYGSAVEAADRVESLGWAARGDGAETPAGLGTGFGSSSPAPAGRGKALLSRAATGIFAFRRGERQLGAEEYKRRARERTARLEAARRRTVRRARRKMVAAVRLGLGRGMGARAAAEAEAAASSSDDGFLDEVRRRPGMAVRLARARAEARFGRLMHLRADEVSDAKRLLAAEADARDAEAEAEAEEEAEAEARARADLSGDGGRAGSGRSSPEPSSGDVSRATSPSGSTGGGGERRRLAVPGRGDIARILAASRASGIFGVGQMSPVRAEATSRSRRRKVQLAVRAWAMFTLGSATVRAQQAGGFAEAVTQSSARDRGRARTAAQRLLETSQAERRIHEAERQRRAQSAGILPPEVTEAEAVTRRWGNSITHPRSVVATRGSAAVRAAAAVAGARGGVASRSAAARVEAERSARRLLRDDEETIEAEVGATAAETLATIRAFQRAGSPSTAGSLRSAGSPAPTSLGSLRSRSRRSRGEAKDGGSEDEGPRRDSPEWGGGMPSPPQLVPSPGGRPDRPDGTPAPPSAPRPSPRSPHSPPVSPMRSAAADRRRARFGDGPSPRAGAARRSARSASPVPMSLAARSRAVVDVLDDLGSGMRPLLDQRGRHRVVGVLSLPVNPYEEGAARGAEREAEATVLRQAADALDAFSDGGSSVGGERFGGEEPPTARTDASTASDGAAPAMPAVPLMQLRAATMWAGGGALPPVRAPQPGLPPSDDDNTRPGKRAPSPPSPGRPRVAFPPSAPSPLPLVWPTGDTPRRPDAGPPPDPKPAPAAKPRRLTWAAIATIRGLQIEVLLRIHDAAELVSRRPQSRRPAAALRPRRRKRPDQPAPDLPLSSSAPISPPPARLSPAAHH